MSVDQLDNPIWNSLTTEHASIALGGENARRYPPEVGPLAGVREPTAECYHALRPLANETPVVLFDVAEIRPPDGWKVIRQGPIVQMVWQRTCCAGLASETSATTNFRRLTSEDAPAMVALAELTEPGPFRRRTIELGNFYGIFHGEQLVAMAGKRLHLPGLVEVSGVCTHPEARGRGYARLLMSVVIDEIERDGKQAFLHALAQNPAIRLYEQLGFTLRQRMHFAVLIWEPNSQAPQPAERIH